MKKLISFICAVIFFNAINSCEILASAAASKEDRKPSQEDLKTIAVPDEIFHSFVAEQEGSMDALLKWLSETDINNAVVLIPFKAENLLWLKAIDQLSLHDKPDIFNKLLEKNANIANNLQDILNYLEIRKISKQNRARILVKAAAQGSTLSSHINKVHSKDYYFVRIERISPHFKAEWESAKTNADKIIIIEKAIENISKNNEAPEASFQAIISLQRFMEISDFLKYLKQELQAKLLIAEIEKTKLLKNRDQLLPPLLIKAEKFNADYQKRNDADPKLKERLQAVLKAQ